MKMPEVEITFDLNGRQTALAVPADMSALTMLRERLDLAGTKYACGEGECGACTIIVDGTSVNACLFYAVQCDGRTVSTIEGLRGEDGLDPMQQAFVDRGAIQCGYCMPGMIMQARYLADTHDKLSLEDLRRGLEGNVCRCTGYTKVFEAVADVIGIER
jgi:carbon-monoxide dehydrogenase small subunit